MDSRQAAARRTGVLYLLFSLVAIVGEFLLPAYLVPGDATATAGKLVAGELAYRVGILTGLVTLVLFIVVVLRLYDLLQGVDRGVARLMVLLVTVGVATALANQLTKFAPLVLLSGADFLSAVPEPQLDALALGFLNMHAAGSAIATAFWGLWLWPFGVLVIRSGFLPRVLGILLVIAGCAYVVSSATALVLPDHRHLVYRLMTPLYFGEVPIIFWLIIKGVRAPRAQAGPADRA